MKSNDFRLWKKKKKTYIHFVVLSLFQSQRKAQTEGEGRGWESIEVRKSSGPMREEIRLPKGKKIQSISTCELMKKERDAFYTQPNSDVVEFFVLTEIQNLRMEFYFFRITESWKQFENYDKWRCRKINLISFNFLLSPLFVSRSISRNNDFCRFARANTTVRATAKAMFAFS